MSPLTRLCAVATASLLALVACHGGGDSPEKALEARDQALKPHKVRLITPEERTEHPSIELIGETRPFDTVSIASELAGRIDRVLVEVGDRVRPGDPLVEIDRRTFRLRLEQAEAELAATKAELELADKDLERKQDLVSDHTIPQSTFDQSRTTRDLAAARVDAARAGRDLAQRDLERSQLRAPSAGSVAARMTAAGEWTDVGKPLLEIATGDSIRVAARVPELWSPRLAGLKTMEFSVDGFQSTWKAAVYSIQPVVQGSSRSFEVVGTAERAAGGIRPGTYASVRLTSPQAVTSLWVPSSAVGSSDMPQVLQVEDGRVAVRKVQTGRRNAESIEIVSGLAPGEKLIADIAGLQRGLPVEIVAE